MDIKLWTYFFVILLISFNQLSIIQDIPVKTKSFLNGSGTDDAELKFPDKVYFFEKGETEKIFSDMYLVENYVYEIFLELVTDHSCEVSIDIITPDQIQTKIFEAPMSYDNIRYFKIPYTTAFTGNYSLIFIVNAHDTLNIHIKMERTMHVFEDIFGPPEWQDILIFDVWRFIDGMEIRKSIRLKADYYHEIYVKRVSPIYKEELALVKMTFVFQSPRGLNYTLYHDDPVENIDGINIEPFGTEIEGLYLLKLCIDCEVNYVNIAYAVKELGPISEVAHYNQTGAEYSNETDDIEEFNNDSQTFQTQYSVPFPFKVAIFVFVGILTGSGIIVFIYHKRKNKVKFEE